VGGGCGSPWEPATQNQHGGYGIQVKANVIRKYVDKMITLAKDGSLHARRQVRTCGYMTMHA